MSAGMLRCAALPSRLLLHCTTPCRSLPLPLHSFLLTTYPPISRTLPPPHVCSVVPDMPNDYNEGESSQIVALDYRTMPGGPYERYSGGRTATHEVGHYLGLMHTFGDNSCDMEGGYDGIPGARGRACVHVRHCSSMCSGIGQWPAGLRAGRAE